MSLPSPVNNPITHSPYSRGDDSDLPVPTSQIWVDEFGEPWVDEFGEPWTT